MIFHEFLLKHGNVLVMYTGKYELTTVESQNAAIEIEKYQVDLSGNFLIKKYGYNCKFTGFTRHFLQHSS